MRSRIFRAAVCLLVVCCLVCNCALPSQATGVELIVGTAISVAAVAAVGSMLVGLGVSPGSDQTVFDDLVNGAVDMFTEAGKVVGGMMSVWSLTNSSVKYAIEPEIIEMLREWLFGTDIISESIISVSDDRWLYGTYSWKPYPQDVDLSVYPYIVVFYNTNTSKNAVMFSGSPITVISSPTSGNVRLKAKQPCLFYVVSTSLATGWEKKSISASSDLERNANLDQLYWANHDICGTQEYNYGAVILSGSDVITESGTYVTLADDYTAGYIAPSADTLADGYTDWAANSITLPGSEADEDDRVLWPMGLGPDYLGTISKPQPDIWDGTSEYEIPNGITGVSIVSPDSVTTGSYIVIQADVAGSGEYDNVCSCTVTGVTSANTKISSMEFENSWSLECGADEEAETLTITVASVVDPAIAVTKEIAVVKSESVPGTDTEVETGTYTGVLGMIQAGVDRVAEWCSVLVDEVVEIPNKIVEGIKGLFVPDAAAMAAQHEKWTELLADRFGAVYESIALVDDLVGTFKERSAQGTIRIPSVTVDLAGTPFTFGGWDVDVIPDDFVFLVEVCKKIVDILCTLAFLSAMRKRFDRTLEG